MDKRRNMTRECKETWTREWEELTYSIEDSEENKDNFPKAIWSYLTGENVLKLAKNTYLNEKTKRSQVMNKNKYSNVSWRKCRTLKIKGSWK